MLFPPFPATLRLSGQSVSVRGNSVHVQLQLLLSAGNLTVRYDDIQRHARKYRVYIRRAQDNRTVRRVAGLMLSPPVTRTAAQVKNKNVF